jgi:uncharacterized protein YyaL (SSP411 family)
MNRLQQEISPYLLQHAHNPVHWYAWKPEAFEKARMEQKPILVSIGYSTCHWCHVMERESFENEDIAAIMNEYFVCIKVDREERPDVDAIYMEACQVLTGGGGWPLNCFLTPEGHPFSAGTYYPPRPAHNRPSWPQVLLHFAKVWKEQREEVYQQAQQLTEHIRRNDQIFIKPTIASTPATIASAIDPHPTNSLVEDTPATIAPAIDPHPTNSLVGIYAAMRERFDRAEGGFGGAPKFPSSMALLYLLNHHHFTGNPEALEHALFSLKKMIMGGIYDQIGGGFARYATDREWLVPHFEKMLYDNALLVSVMSEAYKLLRQQQQRGVLQPQYLPILSLLATTIEETLAYVSREMTQANGGFYSAQDADSEGVEGKFYVWEKSEIDALLGEESDLFCAYYDVSASGNWEERNILWQPESMEDFAFKAGMNPADLTQRLNQCREILLQARNKRIWPSLDDKILLDWNALMSSAFIAAYTSLGKQEHLDIAIKNVNFLLKTFANPARKTTEAYPPLLHTQRNGIAQYDAFLEDYAFLIAALTELYQVTFETRYLSAAEAYTEYLQRYFYDAATGLFFSTDSHQEGLILRKKDLYDNALPSGNSTMVLNFQRLGVLSARADWSAHAVTMLNAIRETVERYPLSFERWATALQYDYWQHDEIAIVGDNAIAKAQSIQQRFWPNKVIAASPTPVAVPALLADKTGDTDALIYVCRNFACERPVHNLN